MQCDSREIVLRMIHDVHCVDIWSTPNHFAKISPAHTSDQISEGGYSVGQTAAVEVSSVRVANPRTESGLTDEKYSSILPAACRETQPRTTELV